MNDYTEFNWFNFGLDTEAMTDSDIWIDDTGELLVTSDDDLDVESQIKGIILSQHCLSDDAELCSFLRMLQASTGMSEYEWSSEWWSILRTLGWTEEEMEVVFASDDAYEYGRKLFGFKRIHGAEVETETLKKKDLFAIARGLYEIYGNQVEFEQFNICVASTGDYFTDVPFAMIKTADIDSIRRS